MAKFNKKATGAVCAVTAIIALVYSDFGGRIRTSEQGLELIGNAEGCRRDPYQCSADVLTVGIGSTAYGGEQIDSSKRYTDKEIAERWVNDIVRAEQCVNQFANGYKIPQSVFDSAVSLTFNVGCGNASKSTMFKKINREDYVGACNELSKWVYAGGRKLNGLVTRREKEKELCLAGLQNH